MKLWVKILISLGIGVVLGLSLGERAVYLRPIGTIFINLISMLVIPLVFASMTTGITSIHDPRKLGRVGIKSLSYYLVTTAIAVGFGLFFATLLKPGAGVNFQVTQPIEMAPPPTLGSLLLDIIPKNPITSLAQGNVLQVIVFAIFLGLAINLAGEKGRPLMRFIQSLADVMYRLTSIVMEFAPFGVAAIMAWVVGTFGWKILLKMGIFLGANYLACACQLVFIFGGFLWFIGRLSPIPFFKGMGDAIALAFSTCSSSATLPVSMHCARENLGVSAGMTNFILPLGSTVNMNGAAIFQATAALFVAQAFNIALSPIQVITVVVTAIISAIGAAGIPGTSFVMLSLVLTSAGLPTEGIAVLFGVDRVREMVSTVVNVLGDAVVAVLVSKSEGELDVDQYNQAELVGFEESEV